jgi:hypothetical protein
MVYSQRAAVEVLLMNDIGKIDQVSDDCSSSLSLHILHTISIEFRLTPKDLRYTHDILETVGDTILPHEALP